MSEWIAVSDRLPDEGQTVLVVLGGYVRAAFRRTTKYHKNPEKVAQWQLLLGGVFDNPTHWMPLPEPPK
jgi:hypothetical protein